MAQTRLSTESSNPYIEFANGSFIGDYSQVAFGANGVAYGSAPSLSAYRVES